MVQLVLTFMAAGMDFSCTRTNLLGGAVHLLIFAAYILLMFDR